MFSLLALGLCSFLGGDFGYGVSSTLLSEDISTAANSHLWCWLLLSSLVAFL